MAMPSPHSGAIIPAASPTMHTSASKMPLDAKLIWLMAM
jgi:hypothetical protein